VDDYRHCCEVVLVPLLTLVGGISGENGVRKLL